MCLGLLSASCWADLSESQTSALNAVIQHLEHDYVDPEVGKSAANLLVKVIKSGEFKTIKEGPEFASAVSELLQEFTGDGHLNLEYSEQVLEPEQNSESYSDEQMEKWYGAHINYGVEKAERLEGNVGLLDLRVFSPIDMGGETVRAAMNMLAETDALIIDLRNNGGGIGDTADLVASYLFEAERQPLTGTYDRPSDTVTQRFTQPYVPGKRFGVNKPVYVLISERTFSAAEALAYNLQALGRAKIVGQTSGGGAHPFQYLPVTEHYVLWSVTAKSVNPITGSNWQGVGVKPDIESEADDALAVALNDLSTNSTN